MPVFLQLSGYDIDRLVDQLVAVVRPMLEDSFIKRPTAQAVLVSFDRMFPSLMEGL